MLRGGRHPPRRRCIADLQPAGQNGDVQPTADDHVLAGQLAGAAGELLVALRARHEPGAERGALGDAVSDAFLLAELRRLRPKDHVLSEESADDLSRLGVRRVWIVDPLDGTREFCEADRVDWAVHVALTIDGVACAGAVALPAQDWVATTHSRHPARPDSAQLRMVVSRSRATPLVTDVADIIGALLVPLGSAGAKAMAVLRGDAEIYLHTGGMYEWDSCAPVAVAVAAGLHCSRVDGSPLSYNNDDPLLPDLLVCRPELAQNVLAAIRKAGVLGA